MLLVIQHFLDGQGICALTKVDERKGRLAVHRDRVLIDPVTDVVCVENLPDFRHFIC